MCDVYECPQVELMLAMWSLVFDQNAYVCVEAQTDIVINDSLRSQRCSFPFSSANHYLVHANICSQWL